MSRRYDQQLLGVAGQAQPVEPPREVASAERIGRHVLDLGEACRSSQDKHLVRCKEAEPGRSTGARTARGGLDAGTNGGLRQLDGQPVVGAGLAAAGRREALSEGCEDKLSRAPLDKQRIATAMS